MEKKFDPTKPVQVRDGRKARILCTDSKLHKNPEKYPIIAEVEISPGQFSLWYRESDGRWNSGADNPLDLVNTPERKTETRYVTEYMGGFSTWNNRPDHTKIKVLGELDFVTEDGELLDVVFRK